MGEQLHGALLPDGVKAQQFAESSHRNNNLAAIVFLAFKIKYIYIYIKLNIYTYI